MLTAISVSISLVLDAVLGEPKQAHPLAAFGRWAEKIEHRLYGGELTFQQRQWRGILAWLVVVMPIVLLVAILDQIPLLGWLLAVGLLYLALGSHSLIYHARQVVIALQQNDIELARERVGMMVSRDTSKLDETAINKATIESVLENGCDAIFGALFWFVVLGAPGVVLYRLANTLDAMWGYRNDRYHAFGWCAAKVDDLLNWIPARLTAASYAMMGNLVQSIACWQQQASQWSGRNAGTVMASGAGALLIRLGGNAVYHGKEEQRAELGTGAEPQVHDIERAIGLVQRSTWLWVIVLFVGGWASV